MKAFLCRAVLFAVLVVLADGAVGGVGRYCLRHARSGQTASLADAAMRLEADMLVMGSSRAVHHYDPRILADSLGVEVYNCGLDGMGILHDYMCFKAVSRRRLPRLIICDVWSVYDVYANDNMRYLAPARRALYDVPGVDSVFWRVSPAERIKMCSQMYRYNSAIVAMAGDLRPRPLTAEGMGGYEPFTGTLPAAQATATLPEERLVHPSDPLKLYYWKRLMDECRAHGVGLVLVFSPLYAGDALAPSRYAPLVALCQARGVPVADHLNDTAFVGHAALFADRVHLNRTGAERLSAVVAAEVRRCLSPCPLPAAASPCLHP